MLITPGRAPQARRHGRYQLVGGLAGGGDGGLDLDARGRHDRQTVGHTSLEHRLDGIERGIDGLGTHATPEDGAVTVALACRARTQSRTTEATRRMACAASPGVYAGRAEVDRLGPAGGQRAAELLRAQ